VILGGQAVDESPCEVDMVDITALEKAVGGEIWAEPRAYRSLVELCDQFGPRFAGSPAYDRAAEWARDRLLQYGLTNVHTEPVEHLGWERGQAVVQVLGPHPAEFPALGLPYSPAGEVEAELVNLGAATPEAFAGQKDALAGKHLLVTAENPPFYPRSVHRTEKYARAVQAGASGFLFVGSDVGQIIPTGSLAHGRVGEILGVGISAEVGGTLQRWRAEGPLRLRLIVRGGGPRPALSHNVIGELPGGPDEGAPLIILCAHLDSHDIAPGADDNASGVVSVLEAARALVAAGARLPARVRVIFFAAEELGLLGAHSYVNAHQAELEHVRLVLNADVTGTPGKLFIALQGAPELTSLIQGYVRTVDGEAQVVDHLVPYSDHFPFSLAGVPSVMVASLGGPGSRGFAHTSADTLDKVSSGRLQATAMALARLVLRASYESDWPARRHTPEQVREVLVRSGLEEPLRLDGRWPF
jgi:Zn-dependent M28 family amino/carboxypeptidase